MRYIPYFTCIILVCALIHSQSLLVHGILCKSVWILKAIHRPNENRRMVYIQREGIGFCQWSKTAEALTESKGKGAGECGVLTHGILSAAISPEACANGTCQYKMERKKASGLLWPFGGGGSRGGGGGDGGRQRTNLYVWTILNEENPLWQMDKLKWNESILFKTWSSYPFGA